MIDIQLIRDEEDLVKTGVVNKGGDVELVDDIKKLDKEKRRLQVEIEAFQANLNAISKEISKQFGQKKLDLIKEASQISAEIEKHRPKLLEMESDLDSLLKKVPNLPLSDVIKGGSDKDNKVWYKKGKLPEFSFTPKDHVDLAKQLDLIDFEAAARASGSRFAYLKGQLTILEISLMRYGMDFLISKGFVPIIPPVLMSGQVMEAAGYLINNEDEIYKTQDDLYLAGTSEQPLLALHAGQIIPEENLPLRYMGISSCFRREAGSYGKDVRGILRMHQFQKLEMFVFTTPDKAEEDHKHLLALAEELMEKLEIPYQVINICSGDLNFSAAKKWDIEAWMAGQGQYRETHSLSNCTDFQARSLNIRYKRTDGKIDYLATLNGTAFSERPLISILENNQQADGSILIPKVLVPYTGFKVIK